MRRVPNPEEAMSLLVVLSLTPALASSTGRTGKSVTGCTPCHGASPSMTTAVAFAVDDPVVAPGQTISVSFTVMSTSMTATAAGFDVSAEAGTLAAGPDNQLLSGEVTHTAPTPFTVDAHTFVFDWTAPPTPGDVTLFGAGNAVNQNGTNQGDGWNTATLTLTVDGEPVEPECEDLDGDGFDNCSECDDTDVTVFPGADETCNGLDDNCDGEVDEEPVDGALFYLDGDGDGAGDGGMPILACDAPPDHVSNDADCDDGDPTVIGDCGDDGGRGCSTAPAGGWAFGLGLIGLLLRRRRAR